MTNTDLIARLRGILITAVRANYAVLGPTPIITANETIRDSAAALTAAQERISVLERHLPAWIEVLASLAETYAAMVAADNPAGPGLRHPAEQRRYDNDMMEWDAAQTVLAEMRSALAKAKGEDG